MANEKTTPVKKYKNELEEAMDTGFYKGYDVRWLRGEKNNHPDGHLVDEYDQLVEEAQNGKTE